MNVIQFEFCSSLYQYSHKIENNICLWRKGPRDKRAWCGPKLHPVRAVNPLGDLCSAHPWASSPRLHFYLEHGDDDTCLPGFWENERREIHVECVVHCLAHSRHSLDTRHSGIIWPPQMEPIHLSNDLLILVFPFWSGACTRRVFRGQGGKVKVWRGQVWPVVTGHLACSCPTLRHLLPKQVCTNKTQTEGWFGALVLHHVDMSVNVKI